MCLFSCVLDNFEHVIVFFFPAGPLWHRLLVGHPGPPLFFPFLLGEARIHISSPPLSRCQNCSGTGRAGFPFREKDRSFSLHSGIESLPLKTLSSAAGFLFVSPLTSAAGFLFRAFSFFPSGAGDADTTHWEFHYRHRDSFSFVDWHCE